MEMSIYERIRFLVSGGRDSYLHNNGKENKQTTALQNLLDFHIMGTDQRRFEK